MSSLEFNINARDQASQVVASVQKKVADFGKDVGKSIAAIVGPMAIFQYGLGKVSEYFEDLARKRKEAFDWGAGLGDSAKQLGVTVEEFQNITEAATRTGESVENVGKAFKLARDLIEQARAGSTNAAESITALGLNIEDLDKLKAQDVLKALAGALAATEDPAQRAQIAVAALGKEAAALQATLAKGFDIGGALESTIGLTTAEQEFLRRVREKEAGRVNRERLAEARRQVTEEFLGTPEGQQILLDARKRVDPFSAEFGQIMSAPSEAAKSPTVQAMVLQALELQRLKREAEAKAALSAAGQTQQAQAASQALSEKAAQDAEREAKKKEAKDEQKPTPKVKLERTKEDKPVGVTVSSLREIGGGLAGEMSTFEDVAFQSLGEQKQMNETLRRIEAKLIPSPASTDFTKDPRVGGVENFTPGNFTPGPMTAASRIGVA